MRVRLTARITLLIVLVLVLGFGVSTILTIQRESALLVEQNKMAARRLIGTLVSSIETAMLSERPDITRGLIDDLRNSKLVQGLVVYRRNGVEAFTDLATLREVSKEAELPQGVTASIEKMRREPGRTMAGPLFTRALETLETQEALESRDGATVFTVYQPIENRERCQGCHGSDHKVRAVIQAATSMEPVMAEVRVQRNRQILIGLLTIVAAAAVLAVAMRQVVVRPIHELAAVARRIGEGDFTVRALAAPGDEVGELGLALNDMTAHLAKAREDLASRNTELATALESLQASRQRLEVLEQLKGELSKFVPDAVKDLLERDPTATSLEKRSEEVSVLFLDIAGYTRLSETIEARRLNQLVQTYFSSFLEIIRAHHGDVNETAGDGL
ncbi:MAG TPA: HAMP domain-containing protein, partial [Methylomirabilota bacterium]